ncbi:MAG TPA: hypothetical protein VGG06_15245 [Thermoanaerobaculia bacterium]|jgi:hypothetical protein
MRVRTVTVSLPAELGSYVESAPDADSLVAEALKLHRERSLQQELARAYQEDAVESRRLHLEWAPAEADLAE